MDCKLLGNETSWCPVVERTEYNLFTFNQGRI